MTTIPVSKYEELLETVRNLKKQTIRVRELASPLLDTIISISANTGETQSTSTDFIQFEYLEQQDENASLNYSLYNHYCNQARSLSAMDSLLMEQQQQQQQQQQYNVNVASGAIGIDVSRSSSSSSCEPRDKFSSLHHDNMWHSEPSPLNPNLIHKRHHRNEPLSPHESVSPTDMTSVMSFASSSGAAVPFGMCLNTNDFEKGGECEESARQRQQQLDVKVDMVYSLLSVLGTSECPDMGETLLALSSNPDSCRAMRQAGCLSVLVQLVHAKDDENGQTRHKAAQALRNLVHGQADDKQKKRELKILKLLEEIRNTTNASTDDAHAHADADVDGHPIQATENIIKLSFDEGYRHTICELGGIFTLARLIEVEHSRHGALPTSDKCVTLRRYAGMALTNLTFGHGHNKSLLCSFTVFMKCLVAQLSCNTDELRQVSASVLRNLSWRADSASRAALRDAGAVAALMQAAMRSRREATLKSVLSALWNLSAHCSTNKADICAVPGALAFLVDMLGYRSSSTLTIIENAGGILRNVSSHIAVRDDYRSVLREKGCLPLLLQQLKSPSLTVVSNACGTLWNLSAKCEQDQRALWDMGAAPMLRSLNHSKHAMIATGSRAALKNLLSSRPGHNLFNHMDATAREMGLPTLPTLGARKQRALAKDLDQNLSETCDNIEPTSPPCDTQQLVESFVSLTISSKLKNDGNNDANNEDNRVITHLRSDHDNHDSDDDNDVDIGGSGCLKKLTNTSATKASSTQNRNYSDYAETDLDQPTNYSLRYAENDSDSNSDIIPDEEQFDTVKTYCTEGTPLNFSTATSMSDLRQIDANIDDNKDNKDTKATTKTSSTVMTTKSIVTSKYRKDSTNSNTNAMQMRKVVRGTGECQSSGLMTPEKPVKYCEEGTPRSFSRHSSFSSLNIDDTKQNTDEKQTKPEVTVVTMPSTTIDVAVNASSTSNIVANVVTTGGAEETPLMFSRCSSLCSLSSADQHSIHDDRSSIISDFSRLTSGIVSPSELPDSPTQTVPPSPRQRRAPQIDFTPPKPQTKQPQQQHQQMKSVFEDNIIKFKQANTPIEFSANTSLSSLTIDDEPTNINYNILTGIVLGNSNSMDKMQTTVTSTTTKTTLESVITTTTVATSSLNQNEPVDEQEEDDMLAACINIGIQNNRHREKKQLKAPCSNKLPVRCRTNIPMISKSIKPSSSSSSQSQSLLPEVDSTRVYCTEDTPAMLSHAGSQSDLSLLSVESSNRKRAENVLLDLSDDSSSNLSGDNESNILAECIQSGMPKPKTPTNTVAAARDETATYAVEDSPCQFSLRSSLSDLTIDGVKITPNKKINQLVQPPQLQQPQPRSRAESLSSLSVESFGSTENAEQVLLEQCISSGMPPKNKTSSPKNGQASSVTKRTNSVTGDDNIKNEYVNTKKIIENFSVWPQQHHEHHERHEHEHNTINTEIIVKNNLDIVDKCSELLELDGSIEDNNYEQLNNRMLDPDAMIESLDRFTAELVSQSSHLQQSYGTGSNGNANDGTWNEDTSPNDISFPSISVSAPLVASFNSESENNNKSQEHEQEANAESLDTTSTMTESTLIAIEAANIVNTVQQQEMQESITSLDLEHMKPPSVMDSLVSLTSSISEVKMGSPVASRKRSLPIGNLMMRRALTNKNSYENLHQIHDGPNSISSSSCSNLDYCKPPSVMGDFLDLVDMENSMISVASITSDDDKHCVYMTATANNPHGENIDDLCDSTADLITDNIFQDCVTHQIEDITLTEYSDANSVTPIQSDFGSSSAESTPKKERSLCTRMTPKQRRQYAKDRYKTYTVAAEMCIKQVAQTNDKQNKLTPKERRQLDRERFQTRVLDVDSIQKQINRQENKQSICNQDDLHVVLAQQANIVLDTLHADELLDCETLSLVSNDDESELNSVSSINYRTYHKSWGFTKNNLPIVKHQEQEQEPEPELELEPEPEQLEQPEQPEQDSDKPKIPKIVKPNISTTTMNANEDSATIEEQVVKTVRGRRKPLYSASSTTPSLRNKTTTTPIKTNIKQPFRTMTSNLVKNVTTTIKRSNNVKTLTNKPPISKLNVVRSNTTPFNKTTPPQQQKIEMKKPELLKNRSSSNGSIPLNSKPLERQSTFTKDNTKKPATPTTTKIPESKIPTNKFRSSVQNRTISSTTSTTGTGKTNRSPSTDRSDFGFRNRRQSPNTPIHQSNSTQSLQNGCGSSSDNTTMKRSSNPDITDATPKRKPVASRIASLWKKSHSDVGHTNKDTVQMRNKTTTNTTNNSSSDETKRLSRLGSFIKVDKIPVT